MLNIILQELRGKLLMHCIPGSEKQKQRNEQYVQERKTAEAIF
jgi:hypothetical protein